MSRVRLKVAALCACAGLRTPGSHRCLEFIWGTDTMTDRRSSVSSNSNRDTIQGAEFDEVREYPEPRQWTPSSATVSANATFTGYIFELVQSRFLLKCAMWIIVIAGNSYILGVLFRNLGLVFEFYIWPGIILVTNNVVVGLLGTAVFAAILCWKWRAQLRLERAAERQ